MSNSRQLGLGPMEVSRNRAAALDNDGSWVLRCVEQALDQVMNWKSALDAMRIGRAQLRRELDGIGHLSVARLGLLPEQYWRALFYFVGEHFGWNFAVVMPTTRPLTDSERLDHARTAIGANYLTILELAQRAVNGETK